MKNTKKLLDVATRVGKDQVTPKSLNLARHNADLVKSLGGGVPRGDSNLTSTLKNVSFGGEISKLGAQGLTPLASQVRTEVPLEKSIQGAVDLGYSQILQMLEKRDVPIDQEEIPNNDSVRKQILEQANESFQKCKEVIIKDVAKELDMSPEEVMLTAHNNIRKMLSPDEKLFVAINVCSERELLGILKCKEYQTVHQLNESGVAFDRVEEKKREEKTSEFILRGKVIADPAKTSVYGHITKESDGAANNTFIDLRLKEVYGRITLVLKPEVINDIKVTLDGTYDHAGYRNSSGEKSRTYVPFGEPFKTIEPVDLTNPNINAIPWDNSNALKEVLQTDKLEDYLRVVEARISREERPLTLSAIQKVVYHRPFMRSGQDEFAKVRDQWLLQELREGFMKHGIPIEPADHLTEEKVFGDLKYW